MSTAVMIVIIAVVVVAAVGAGFLLWSKARTLRLRRKFGPEYDRTLARHQSRREAEGDLRARERRHQQLDIQPLDDSARDGYRERWIKVQEQFVDSPETALSEADRLVITVMDDRGYPTDGYDQRVAHLSVEHGRTIDYYRRGHEISSRAVRSEASTEDMRQAMVHYRALLEDLLAVPAAERADVPPLRKPNFGRSPAPDASDGAFDHGDNADEARAAETGVPAEVAAEESRTDDERLRRAERRDAG